MQVEELFRDALRLEDLGRPLEALERYRSLLALQPAHADAWHNQGLLLARQGRLEEAERSHRNYAKILPASSRAHSDLADVLLAQEHYAEALEQARLAADLDAQAFLPAFTAGLAEAMQTNFQAAQQWFQRARRADADGFERFIRSRATAGSLDRDLDPRAIYLIREFDRLELCDWRHRSRFIDIFRGLIETGDKETQPLCAPPLMFRSFHLPLPVETRRKLADNVAARFVLGAKGLRASPPVRHQGSGRLRVGYVSPDFRTHPTGMMSAALFRLHDRSRFEVHAFSLGLPDDSPWRRAIQSTADRFHDLAGLSLSEALSRVRAAEVDVLIDLAAVTNGALPELFAARAAPVQVSYLGFPGTSGAGLVDYLVCDHVCVPPGESAAYAEALVRLPQTYWICDPREPVGSLPERASCGLPEKGIVFLAHHPSRKIYPEAFSAWMEILAAVPRSTLWLLQDYGPMRDNLVREAGRRGIAPERLVFAPRVPHAEHRTRIGLADLALDTPLCNGGSTTLDALAAGVPVLTSPSPGLAGKMSASALTAAGLADLVLTDLSGYVSAAIDLASDPQRLRAVTERVQGARSKSALFDTGRRVRELEAAYQHMHERALRGDAPASFDMAAP